MPISANGNFDRWGQPYNISRVISADIVLNDEGYKEYSMLFMSTTYTTVYALSFTLATAAIVHTIIYNGKDIYLKYKNAHTEMEDVHAKLMRNYPEVPDWWYWASFVVSTSLAIALIEVKAGSRAIDQTVNEPFASPHTDIRNSTTCVALPNFDPVRSRIRSTRWLYLRCNESDCES
jgi:hypothetical protein